MWGCKAHWFALPKHLRDRIWATYRRGQEITKTPSREYLDAAQAVRQWIRDRQQVQHTRDLQASEAVSLDKTLARSPRRVSEPPPEPTSPIDFERT